MQYVQKPYRPSPAPAGTTRRDTRSITPPQFRAATQFSTRRADFQQRAIVREAEIQSTSNGIAAVREAMACKESGEEKVILTALCGHGHLDLAAYETFLSGQMVDLDLPDSAIQEAMQNVPNIES